LEGSLLGGFLYLQVLDVSMVVPATGSLAGGERVELSGSGFQRGATVRFDGVPATDVRVLSPGRISVRTPPGRFGTVDVRVDNADGRYVVKPAAFLYSNLVVSRVLGRHIPYYRYDGPIRPAEKLPRGVPRAVVMQEGMAWLLSEGESFANARSPEELLQESLQAAVTLVDVRDPDNAAVRSGVSIAPPYQPRALAVRGSLGYVAADATELPYVDVVGEGGPSLLVVDATELQAPRLVTAVPFEGQARAVALADDLVLVAAGSGGLAIFSVAEPARPVLTGSIQRMRVKGELRPVDVLGVATSGRYGLVRVDTGAGAFTLVLDLATPGLEVVGEAADLGPMALLGQRGLVLSNGQVRTLSFSPPTWPRALVGMASLVGGTPRIVAVGPHVGAAGTEVKRSENTYASGKLEVSLSADPSRPRAVDAVDLFPAARFGGIAVERDVAVISISATLLVDPISGRSLANEAPMPDRDIPVPPADGLAVVRMPFLMGVGSQPADGATEVPPSTPLRLEFNRELAGVSAETVRLIRQDGSVNGVVEPTGFQVIGRTVMLLPAQPLVPATTYRVVAERLTDAATRAEMAGPFYLEFSTAAGSGAMPVSLAGLTPREGPAAGGTLVTVTGTGFEPGATVRFGGVPATQVTVSADGTRLTARTAANVAGAAMLEVANPSGGVARRLGAFLFTQPLSLSSATPARGPASGGTRVILTGTGFSSAGVVQARFAGVPALRTRVLGLNRLEVYTPRGLRGAVDIQVINPDGSQATLKAGFIFDQPGGASVALASRPVDVVVVGDSALVLQRDGLSVVDLSGLYRKGPLQDTPIPPDRADGLIDEDRDKVDDRFVSFLPIAEGLSLAYPSTWGDRLFVGTGGWNAKAQRWTPGGVLEVNLSSLTHPSIESTTGVARAPVFGLDVRDERLLAAAGETGLGSFDVSHAPFLVGALPASGPVQAVAATEGRAVLGVGQRDASFAVSGGELRLVSTEASPSLRGSLPLDVQRARWLGPVAVVAAGSAGLVLVDATDVAQPLLLATVPVGGFAWDVRLQGNLAYVAAGSAGVAVVDLTDASHPRVLYHVTGANGGEAKLVEMTPGGRLLSLRDRGTRGWSVDFGRPSELAVVSASVVRDEVVPLSLPSLTVTLSAGLLPSSAPGAFSFTADGVPVPGTLEAGTPDMPVSTLVFRPSAPLPVGARLRLALGTSLRSLLGDALVAPFEVNFRAAGDNGERPLLLQVVPRVGPSEGGTEIELLGTGFVPGTTVLIGGNPAPVLSLASLRMSVRVPAGEPGLADVVVVHPSGVTARRSGGYFYSAPLFVDSAIPRFLNPKGGSSLRMTGRGFLPTWSSPLGSTRVLIRGLPVRGVTVESTSSLMAVAGPGSFGDADVEVVAADGLQRASAPSPLGYGLPFSGKVTGASVVPLALAPNPAQPLLPFAAAGASVEGNRFPQPYTGSMTGGGLVTESFRMVAYDVTRAGSPELVGASVVDPPDAQVDYLIGSFKDLLEKGLPLPEVEMMPDSMDVAVRGHQLLVANGASGLSVIDVSGTTLEQWPLLGRGGIGSVLGEEYATRLLPTPTGAWVLTNDLSPNLAPREEPCPFPTSESYTGAGTGGALALFDTRDAADPVLLGRVSGGGTAQEPYGATVAGGRLLVAMGNHAGVIYCEGQPFPPPPWASLNSGHRTKFVGVGSNNEDYAAEDTPITDMSGPHGALELYDSAGVGARRVARRPYPYSLTDVVVVRDVAIVAAAEYGLLFFDVRADNPEAPKELLRLPFDEALSNTPGHPQRMRLIGDLLFVSAASGGVYVVDVADPRHPEFLSGGNTERAFDVLPVGDRLLVASRQELTELSVPFLLPLTVSPEREALVPPSLSQLEVRFNRPLVAATVNASSVTLSGPSGLVPLELSVVADHATLTYALRARLPGAGLTPGSTYALRIESTVADQRGGAMIRPFHTTFRTGAAGSLQPRIDAVEPAAVSMAGGQQVVLRGAGLGHVSKVRLGGTEATLKAVGDSELRVLVPPSVRPGPVDVHVEDSGGPWALLPHGLLYLSPFAGSHAHLQPDHGSTEGGTVVTVSFGSASPVAPGTRVRIGDRDGVDVDVVSLSSVRFTTPRPDGPGLVPVRLVRPGEAPETVGFFSYDLPTGTTVDLPGFPPRETSEVVLSGDVLLAGVPTPKYEGLELFNIRVPEHPIRLGGLRTDGPVRGVDARGALALLATDLFGLVAVDVQTPAHPFVVGRATTAGLATGVRLEGSLAHVSVTQMDGGAGYVQTFDVSQPSLPLVSTTPLTEDALALEPTPGRFYALTSNVRTGQKDGLRLSISTRQGQRVGGVGVDATPRTYEELVRSRLTVRGGRAYVTVGSRLYVFDVSNEAAPVVLQSTELGAPALGLTWSGGSLLVSTSGDSTLVTVPPTDLLVVGTSPVNGALAAPFASIRVDMSLPVQPDSVTAGTFEVTQVGPGGTRPVEGTREVVFATRGSSLVFTPAAPLVPGSRIEVTVDGVRGFDTRPLAQPVSFAFTVAGEDSLQPVVDRLEPASGLVGDFTATTVWGAGFRDGVGVRVAGQVATVVSVQPDRIEIVVPPSLTVAGPAAVEVVDPSGLSAVRLGGFLYREPLRLALLSPDRSPQQGGVAVELRGTGFIPGLGMRFGGTDSFQVEVSSMERAVAVAPPHAQGLVDVEARLGTRSALKARSFLYGTGAVARLPTPPVRDVRVEGTVAYVALGGESDIVGLDAEGHLVTYEQGRKTGSGGLMVADIGEPTVAREVRRLSLGGVGGVRRMAKVGNTLYLAAGSQGVVAVDVTQPANAAVTLTLPVQGEAMDVVASDSVLFVADGSGVRVFRTGETEQPMLVAQRSLPGGASALALYDGLLLVSNASPTDARLHVLDARRGDLAPLTGESWLSLAAPARHIAVEGTRAFVSLGRAGQVAIVELTDPTAPAPAGTLVLKDELNQGWVS
ncbi:MAG: IPT/TIG domain-containing protein, partial [Cystobacter sp.]